MNRDDKEELSSLLWEFFTCPDEPVQSEDGARAANLVDGLFAIARAVDRLTDILEARQVLREEHAP